MSKRQSSLAASADWRLLLKNRNVAWLVTGQAISQIGDGLSKLALLWFVYDLTGSALEMTMIGILQTIPPLAFGPFVGVLLDRVPKRSAMIVIASVRAGLLAFIPTMYWMGLLSLPLLYVLVFVTAMFSMAFGPALKAMEPQLVPSRSVGANQRARSGYDDDRSIAGSRHQRLADRDHRCSERALRECRYVSGFRALQNSADGQGEGTLRSELGFGEACLAGSSRRISICVR